ncbi:MAG: ABC transporter permease subunit [Alphaproteobacteria bacterium TMED89]|nr:ABC transporter permease [Rhodospirillaceae bacterium]RPH12746.1 MAG: ABC transporter permease subunit [Alphaproteobacteria bacterium TMED89]
MGDLKFDEFGDIWIFLLTVPGHLFNLVFGLGKFLVISLPITLYQFVIWLGLTLIELPVTLFKFARVVLLAGWGTIKNLYLFLVTNDWSWNALNDFPSLPSEFRVLLNLGGINKPFDYFAGSYGFAVKEFILPLRRAMNDLRDFIDFMPWPIFFALVLLLVFWVSRKMGVVLLALAALLFIGVFGLMELASQTFSLMILSIILCVLFGIPLGIFMSASDAVDRAVKPILDLMQTMPSFVYLIPVLILFGVSPVAGLIAVVIYAMPPVVRLTNLGIRLVPFEVVEASHAFGATYIQRLFGTLIPLALPNVFAGINQTIMMALAMVVIAALVGAPGLGAEVLSAQGTVNLARGLQSGTAVALIAIVIDRSLYLYGDRMQQHRKVGH